jgi:hypothetical protein
VLQYFMENPAPTDEYRTVGNALEVLKHYRFRQTLPDYEWELLSDEQGLIVERAFELPLGVVEIDGWIDMPWLNDADPYVIREGHKKLFVSHIHLAWSGRIDALVRDRGLVRVCDHKTSSIAGENFVMDFLLSNQTLGYVWAGRQLWPQYDVRGFLLNAIHFKKPTGSGPINEPGPRGGPAALSFFRSYFDYSPSRLAEWEENAMTIVEDFLHCLVRGFFPRYTKQCFGKYGKCQYHDVCSVDDRDVRHRLLHSDMYKPVTWNPTAK